MLLTSLFCLLRYSLFGHRLTHKTILILGRYGKLGGRYAILTGAHNRIQGDNLKLADSVPRIM